MYISHHFPIKKVFFSYFCIFVCVIEQKYYVNIVMHIIHMCGFECELNPNVSFISLGLALESVWRPSLHIIQYGNGIKSIEFSIWKCLLDFTAHTWVCWHAFMPDCLLTEGSSCIFVVMAFSICANEPQHRRHSLTLYKM